MPKDDIRLRIPGFRRYAADLERLEAAVAERDALRARLVEVERKLEAKRASRLAAGGDPAIEDDVGARPPDLTTNAGFDELRRACEALEVRTRLKLLERLDRGLIRESQDGILFGCRSRVEYKRIQKRKRWDAPIVEWIRSFASSDAFFDIGANVGSFSLLAGKLHAGRVPVFSFEPGFETFAALARNVLLNNLERAITPLQIALFDETGLRPFHYHELGAGSALHAVGEPIDDSRQRFEPVAVQPVPTFRLDDLVEQLQLPRPTRVKLDVDGAEARVLAGATHTLGTGPCELWVELTDVEPGDAVTQRTICLLTDLGFELVRRVDHDAPQGTYPYLCDVFFKRG